MTDFLQIAGLLVIGPVVVLLLIWFITSVARHADVALATGISLTVLSLTEFGLPEMRQVIAFVTIPHLAQAINVSKLQSNRLPSLRIPAFYTSVCFLSIFWSLAPLQTAVSASAWLVLLLFIFTFRSLISGDRIRQQVFFILLIFFLASLLSVATPLGWEAGRVQGVFNNANAAGIFTFLLIGLAFWMGKRYWIWLVPLGTVFIGLTGSRASLLALLVLLTMIVIGKTERKLKIPLIIMSVSLGGPIAYWAWNDLKDMQADGSSILRTNNSRDSVWDLAIDFIRENPVLGAGYGATPEGIGSSSYFKLIAEFGLVFSGVGIFLALFYIWCSRYDFVLLGLTLATLVNTVFEDWLLTAGAPMLIIYLLILFSTPQYQIPSHSVVYTARFPTQSAKRHSLS